MAEDCLYLNVTAPAGTALASTALASTALASTALASTALAGTAAAGPGRYCCGSTAAGSRWATVPTRPSDGAAFARSHGLVVVTFNYRLGALGFLDVPGERPTGALGLHDQVAVLRWTRDNIAAFGGDPGQVTVYGLSAGGKSVTNLLASPLASGLFRRAAESSGGDHVKTPAQAASVAARFFGALGTTPERVRSVPAAEILAAQLAVAEPPQSTWIWRPSVDGVALTAAPVAAIAGGAAAGVPLLLQTCARETALYQLLGPDAADQAERVLAGYFGAARAATMLASYAAAYPELDETALRGVAVMSDERYVVRTERLADAQAAHAPVWRSRYDGPYTGIEDDPDPEFAQYAACLAARTAVTARASGAAATARPRRCMPPGARSRRSGTPAGPGTPATAGQRWSSPRTGAHVSRDPFAHARGNLGGAGLAAGYLVARCGHQLGVSWRDGFIASTATASSRTKN